MCIKVRGPVTAANQHPIFCGMGQSTLRHLSLVTDTNLDETELFYLRWIHQNIRPERSSELILPHLWSAYGATFQDKSLLYATICFALYRHRGLLLSHLPDDEINRHFLSRLRTSLSDAITANAVSECHLFATFLVMQCCNVGSSEYRTHENGFAAILEFLLEDKNNLHCTPRPDFRVQYLHYFMCSWTATWGSGRIGKAWTLLDHIPVPDRAYEMPILKTLPASFWRRTRTGLQVSSNIEWNISVTTLERMWHEFHAILVALDANDISVILSERMDSLVFAKRHLEDAIAMPRVRKCLEAVPS